MTNRARTSHIRELRLRYRTWRHLPLCEWSDRRWWFLLAYSTILAIAVTIVLNVWVFLNWSR